MQAAPGSKSMEHNPRASRVRNSITIPTLQAKDKKLSDELVCNISKSGKLIEMGYDPLTKAPESTSMATQTQGSWKQHTAQDNTAKLTGGTSIDLEQLRNAPAGQVLRLVVGLLGFEVHEKPNTWAETWLTFHDLTKTQLGIGKSAHADAFSTSNNYKAPDQGPSAYEREQQRWQHRVLQHLKEHVEIRQLKLAAAGGAARAGVPGGVSGATGALATATSAEEASIFGPDFQEHLELAEFSLKRITHAVSVLESPEKDDRPMILRDYSEEMIREVCADLRQWLDQLATLLSLYHVHLLDLEAERSRLSTTLQEREAKFAEGEAAVKAAKVRLQQSQEKFSEEKMKRRAETLLGIQLQGEDAKIYSQKDLDELYAQWEKEHLEPLYADVRELRMKKDELLGKLQDTHRERRPARQTVHHASLEETTETTTGALSKQQTAMLCACVSATNERVLEDGLSSALSNLEEAIKTNSDFTPIVTEINRLPIPEKPADANADEAGGDFDEDMMGGPGSAAARAAAAKAQALADAGNSKCLAAMAEEWNSLEAQLRRCPIASGADKLAKLAAWSRDSANLVKDSITSHGEGGPIRGLPPPKWDLGALNKQRHIRTVGVNTGSDLFEMPGDKTEEEVRRALEKEFQKRLMSMQQEFEAELAMAKEAAERERRNAEEALTQLAAESERADKTLADLRRKLLHMQKYMEKSGHGEVAQDAIHSAGLGGFMSDKNVFVRLYRDAMDRMRRMAEAQARFFEEASHQFLRTVGSIIDPHLRLPGMDIESVMSPEEQRRMMVYQKGNLSQRSSARSASPRSGRKEVWHGNGPPNRIYQTTVKGYQLLASEASTAAASEEISPRRSPPLSPTAGDATTRAAQTRRQLIPINVNELDPEELGGPLSISATSLEDPNIKALRAKAAMQSNGQTVATSVTSRSAKPFGASQKPGTASEHILPPLDIRGHGRGSPSNPLNPGSSDRVRGPSAAVLTGSPTRDLLHEHANQVNLLDDRQPLLAIGSLKTSASTGYMMPLQAVRSNPRHTTAPQRLARTQGSASMPNLEVSRPPRLLVQSVGGA
mmetsp:Transcript_19592/g.35581  ORF Transcript_19592/g.35581 Transcript_19592/m.35581 type:complete len:1062 (-) Transcript_19592:76-3261(-)